MSTRSRKALGVLAGVTVVLAIAWPQLSPDLQRGPIYAYEFLVNDNFVVNTPVLHEIFGHAVGVPDAPTFRSRLRAADGFELNVYASDIAHPRMLRATPAGDLVVSQPRQGRILLVERDADGDGQGDATRVLIADLELPHGIELVDDWLYIAEPHAIRRVRFDVEAGVARGEPELVVELPKTTHHHLRVLRLGPDGWLYVPIGANCNRCEPTIEREGSILRVKRDGSAVEIFATGFRSIVGIDWHPETLALYANDIGADYLGDDFPPEELNLIEPGGFYGFPWVHGDGHADPELAPGNEERVRTGRAPALTFGAHSTPLGMTFLRSTETPEEYRGAAIVAFHGSWNRRRKSGYRVLSLHFREDGRIEERDFVSGFELQEDVIGRPVDVAEGTGGAIYISDDYAGAIYRVTAHRGS
jgi:glucose/arabinose dehydrogenase